MPMRKGRITNEDNINLAQASSVPVANTLVRADGNGKIDSGFLKSDVANVVTSIVPYGRYFIQASGFPTGAAHNDMVYHTSTNKLFRLNISEWVEIDWRELVKNTPEFLANRLRFTSGFLEISPDGTNWFQCFPGVGALNLRFESYDNTAFSRLLYLPPGTEVSMAGSNHIPVVFGRQQASFDIKLHIQSSTAINEIVLRINNTTNTTYYAEVYRNDSTMGSGVTSSYLGPRVGWIGHANSRSYSNFSLSVNSAGIVHTTGNHTFTNTTYGIVSFASNLSIGATQYWLGTLIDNPTATLRTADFISIRRTI